MHKKIIILIALIFLNFTKLASADSSLDPLKQIQSSFPDAVQIGIDGGRNIEFCPDNTCDFFVAKNASFEELKDFAFLYLYFFSDYYILKEWRSKKETSVVLKEILIKLKYKNCRNKIETDSAKCILRQTSKNRMKLFAVRYDENARKLTEIDLEPFIFKKKMKD